MTEEDRAYLVRAGWEQVMTEEDGCESWSLPHPIRKRYPEELACRTQHYWDLDEAVALQRKLDCWVVPVPAIKNTEIISIMQAFVAGDDSVIDKLGTNHINHSRFIDFLFRHFQRERDQHISRYATIVRS